VLDEFEIVLHSSDSIAPVGVIHPLAFHLENKKAALLSGNNKTNDLYPEKTGSVFEVQGDCLKSREGDCQTTAEISDLAEVKHDRLRISKTQKDNTFSISCWLQDSCHTSTGKRIWIFLS
jgi:diphthine-ammonia ligase